MNSYYQPLDDLDVIISDSELDDIYWKMDESNHVTGRKGDLGLSIGASYGSHVINIDKFVNKVMRTDSVAFEITQAQNGRFKVVALPLAKYYPFMVAFQSCHSGTFRYSEPVELFFKCVKSMGLWGFPLGQPHQISTATGKTDGQLFNDLITLIRKLSTTAEFQYKAKHRMLKSRHDQTSSDVYTQSLIDEYQRLWVLRLNPAYQKDRLNDVSIKQAQKHIVKLIRSLDKNDIFKDCVGYITKMEVGDTRGCHFRVALFFNARHLRKSEIPTEQIADFWVNAITQGKGDCSGVNKAKYRNEMPCLHDGIYQISNRPDDVRGNHSEYLHYMTRTDAYNQLREYPKIRTFRRGKAPIIADTPHGIPRGIVWGFDSHVGRSDPLKMPRLQNLGQRIRDAR